MVNTRTFFGWWLRPRPSSVGRYCLWDLRVA